MDIKINIIAILEVISSLEDNKIYLLFDYIWISTIMIGLDQ